MFSYIYLMLTFLALTLLAWESYRRWMFDRRWGDMMAWLILLTTLAWALTLILVFRALTPAEISGEGMLEW